MTEQEAIQKYRDMEERLQSVYGECDGLLESVVAGLEKHEGIKFQKPIKARLLTDEHVDMWEEYKKIGTPEECRAAVEKQKAKIPNLSGDGYFDGKLVYDTYECPNCGKEYEMDYEEHDYCPNCGQHIDWSE